MSSRGPISGFPEWLPPERMVEQHVLDTLRATFELHGFSSVETRAVEPLDQLLSKGETDKEIYVLQRLQEEAQGERDTGTGEPQRGTATGEDPSHNQRIGPATLGLHFDLTVPLARYVLENAGHLQFPFRRYQIQRAWRGERPQEGRYREFTQADIDVIGKDTLSFHHEVEMPLVVADALSRLPIPPIRIQVNNRKIPEGFYRGLGIDDVHSTLRTVDKLDKIGPAAVHELLVDTVGCTDEQAGKCLALAEISAPDTSFVDRVRALGSKHELLDEGLEELVRVVEAAQEHAPGLMVVDLRVARGLDYYTGTVYETQLVGHEDLGSICSGGRYDSLASAGATTYPGVGISVGVSRLLGRLLGRGLLGVSRNVPTCVLVALPDDEARADCDRVAADLRARGIPVEVSPDPAKYGKQIRYAERRGIPFVWFPRGESGGHEVRDIRSGEQVPADPAAWVPPAEDLRPTIVATGAAD